MYIDRRDSLCGELRLPRPCFARARNDGILTGMSLAGLPLHNVSELKASRWGHHHYGHCFLKAVPVFFIDNTQSFVYTYSRR